MDILPMSLTGTTPSELIFKNVLRTVNGLPPLIQIIYTNFLQIIL